jgi:hypothetical protein
LRGAAYHRGEGRCFNLRSFADVSLSQNGHVEPRAWARFYSALKEPSHCVGVACQSHGTASNVVSCTKVCGDATNWLLGGRMAMSLTAVEIRRVDITTKLNVLAVCAAFVFIGAVVLGAF